MIATTTYSRKRSRPQVSPAFKPLPFLALALLIAVSQASAFIDSSNSLAAEAEYQSSLNLQKLDTEKVEDRYGWIVEEADEYEEEEEGWEYYYEDEEEYDDEEDSWTPEEVEEMDALWECYLQKVAAQFGADWEEKFELKVDKEDVYIQYLEFEEEKQERRLLIEESHKALLLNDIVRVRQDYHDGKSLNQTQDQNSVDTSLEKTITADVAPRSHLVVLGPGLGFHNKNVNHYDSARNSNAQEYLEIPAVTTKIVTSTQGGNTHTVLATIWVEESRIRQWSYFITHSNRIEK